MDPVEVESICMNCHKQGTTKIMLLNIPHFRDLLISSFSCDFCNYSNRDVQNAGSLPDQGITFTCTINSEVDLKRQLVCSEYSKIQISELDVEFAGSIDGKITTVESVLQKMIEDLNYIRLKSDIQCNDSGISKLSDLIHSLELCLNSERIITLILDDFSGLSYIESLDFLNQTDSRLISKKYKRTEQQDKILGILTTVNENIEENRLYEFNTECSNCGKYCETKMHILDIPFFKEIILMATTCENCGYKNSEVKASGPMSEKGKKITLNVLTIDDLSRDILKSESCTLAIPEIQLHLNTGTLGGRFTTIEGLLRQIFDELKDKCPFIIGDSSLKSKKEELDKILTSINDICEGKLECTIILDDPLSNSYIQNIFAPDTDPQLHIEYYERSYEQNEEFGLNDIITE